MHRSVAGWGREQRFVQGLHLPVLVPGGCQNPLTVAVHHATCAGLLGWAGHTRCKVSQLGTFDSLDLYHYRGLCTLTATIPNNNNCQSSHSQLQRREVPFDVIFCRFIMPNRIHHSLDNH